MYALQQPQPPPGHSYCVSGPVRIPLSIGRLPIELLIKIFKEIGTRRESPPQHPREPPFKLIPDTIPDLLPKMQVCKAWKRIILGTPALWCNIVVHNRTEWLATCLEYSQRSLVDISFHPEFSTSVAGVVKYLRRFNEKIRTLEFRSVDCSQIGNGVSLGDMPNLQDLRIAVDHKNCEEQRRHHGACPVLLLTHPGVKDLWVDGLIVAVPRELNRHQLHPLSTLRRLYMGGYSGAGTTYDIAGFLTLLQACVSLEVLDIRDNSLDTFNFNIPQGQPTVTLPSLHVLVVYGIIEEVSNFVSHLHIGPEVEIWLETEEITDAVRSAEAARAILPNDPRLPILRTANRVKVNLASPGLKHEAMIITGTRGLNPNDTINIVVRIPEDGFENGAPAHWEVLASLFHRTLTLLPTIFPNAPIETLVCNGELDAIDEETWERLFASYPTLRTLVIEDSVDDGDVCPAFRALSKPQPYANNRPLCPHLEYIYVRNALGEDTHFEEIRRCMVLRMELAPIQHLRLELLRDKRDDVPDPDASVYQAVFAHLVPQSTVVVINPVQVPDSVEDDEDALDSVEDDEDVLDPVEDDRNRPGQLSYNTEKEFPFAWLM